jgi:hypothetical protein
MRNKRCIANVATGDFYCKMQARLRRSMQLSVDRSIMTYNGTTSTLEYQNNTGIDLILWRDCLPENSKLHSESPYGFKVHAINHAPEESEVTQH